MRWFDHYYTQIDALKGLEIRLKTLKTGAEHVFVPVKIKGFTVEFDTFIGKTYKLGNVIIVEVEPIDEDSEFKVTEVGAVWIFAKNIYLQEAKFERKDYGVVKVGDVIKYNFFEN